MGLADPHDPRTFTHFARFDASGHVIAIIEIADSALASGAHPDQDGSNRLHVDVSDLAKHDIDLLTLTEKSGPIAKRVDAAKAIRVETGAVRAEDADV